VVAVRAPVEERREVPLRAAILVAGPQAVGRQAEAADQDQALRQTVGEAVAVVVDLRLVGKPGS
jgi:hypothetical protein